MKHTEEQMNYLDRDSHYRMASLNNAVQRAGQDGGLSNEEVDVLGIAETYYAWFKGEDDSEKPPVEKET